MSLSDRSELRIKAKRLAPIGDAQPVDKIEQASLLRINVSCRWDKYIDGRSLGASIGVSVSVGMTSGVGCAVSVVVG